MTNQELKDQVKTNLTFVDSEIDESHSPEGDDIDGIVGHGMRISALIGLCAKNLADAKKVLSISELQYLQANKELYDKPTILKKLMEGSLADEHHLVLWADRLMAACTHKMDFYRSVLSKYKEELRNTNTFNNRANG